MSKQQAKEAVLRGIKFLDRNYPNWRDRIDWDWLDLASAVSCPGGQLEGEYEKFLDVNSLSTEEGINLGLATGEWFYTYSELTDAWRELAAAGKKGDEDSVILLLNDMFKHELIADKFGERINNAIEEVMQTRKKLDDVKGIVGE